MDEGHALFMMEEHCRYAAVNRYYHNPPAETTFLDCTCAKRQVSCDLCLTRSDEKLEFPAYPLPADVSLSKLHFQTASKRSKSMLTKAESAAVYPKVLEFRNSICRTLSLDPQYAHYPITAFAY